MDSRIENAKLFLSFTKAVSDSRIDKVKALLKTGVSIHDIDGLTAMHYYASDGRTDMVQKLLEMGVNIHEMDEKGLTALHYAAMRGHSDTTQALLVMGADVNKKNVYGFTPLHLAACFGNILTIELLLGARANINAQDYNDMTPVDSTIDHSKENQALLLAYGATPSVKILPESAIEALKLIPDVSFARRKHALMFRQKQIALREISYPIA